MLVQSTLIQEQALEAANTRLQETEERMRVLEEELQRRPSVSGSFLGGLFGGGGAANHPQVHHPPLEASLLGRGALHYNQRQHRLLRAVSCVQR